MIEALAEERKIYLEEHPETKANSFYPRGLITKYGKIENLKVPKVRQKGFRERSFLKEKELSLTWK